jgi:RNA polymerase sigma-70 factor, ECF subfamily
VSAREQTASSMQDELIIAAAQVTGAVTEQGEEAPLHMDEAAFQAFYERTAPSLWSYLRRVSGDSSAADDLLQESYLHFLRAPGAPSEEAHQKNYLFRITTNLLRDRFRAGKRLFVPLPELASGKRAGHEVEVRLDVGGALGELKQRERSLLWLAYVEGYDHKEIARTLGCNATSVRPMLFRARQRLATLLRAKGWKRGHPAEERT